MSPHGRDAIKLHDKQLVTLRTGKFLDLLSHSMLGLIDIYNLLPQYAVDAKNVSEFQKRLQLLVMEMAATEKPGWEVLYSPRNTLWNNKLRKLHDWSAPNAPTTGRAHRDAGQGGDKVNEQCNMRLFTF